MLKRMAKLLPGIGNRTADKSLADGAADVVATGADAVTKESAAAVAEGVDRARLTLRRRLWHERCREIKEGVETTRRTLWTKSPRRVNPNIAIGNDQL